MKIFLKRISGFRLMADLCCLMVVLAIQGLSVQVTADVIKGKDAAVVFEDDFSSGVLSEKWQVVSGTNPVKDGVVTVNGEIRGKLNIKDKEVEKWILEFRAKLMNEGTGDWQAINIVNEDGDYVNFYSQGAFALAYNIEGKRDNLGGIANDNDWHVFKLVKSGDRLKLYMDDGKEPVIVLDNAKFLSDRWLLLKTTVCDPNMPMYFDWIKFIVPGKE